MFLYYAGCAALGLAAGFLVGASSSPVVQYALPLLFALLGSATGLLSLTVKPGSAEAKARLHLVGASALSLVAAFFIASTYAALIRTDRPLSDLIPRIKQQPKQPLIAESDQNFLSGDDNVSVLLLDRSLKAIGVADIDADRARRRLVEQITRANRYIMDNRSRLISSLDELEKSLNSRLGDLAFEGDVLTVGMEIHGFRSASIGPVPFTQAAERASLVAIRSKANEILSSATDLSAKIRSDPMLYSQFRDLLELLAPIDENPALADRTQEQLNSMFEQAGKDKLLAKGSPAGFFAVND